jgi:hypothetical protein
MTARDSVALARSRGDDQNPEIDTCNHQRLYQGMYLSAGGSGSLVPWRLDLLTQAT